MANQNVTQLAQQTGTADTTSLLYAVTGGTTDTGLPLTVLFNNPTFTGTPTVPGYLTTSSASATYAPLASPTFTGTVTVNALSVTTQTISGQFTSSSTTDSTATNTGSIRTAGGIGVAKSIFCGGSFNGAVVASTLSASSTVSGTGFTNYMAAPPAIGSTTPSTGAFTTLSATGLITPSSTVGIKGTGTNDSAQAGSIGEFVTATGTTVAMTSATVTNITSISLTAGDWDVSGGIQWNPAGSTTVAILRASTSATSATNGTFDAGYYMAPTNGFVTGQVQQIPVPVTRYSLSTTTTIYLVGNPTFGTSTMTASGVIRARRVR